MASAIASAIPLGPSIDENFHVEPVRLGTNYHAAMSRPRHDPLTSLLEIVDNVLGRARWEANVRMTECHLFLKDFSTDVTFLVALSNTKISHEDLIACLDQRPKVQDARTHALSVFGDGMKSTHNCLVDGVGNMFLCVQRTAEDSKEYWFARYGKALDDSLGSSDVNKVIARWDPHNNTVLSEPQGAKVRLLGANSPFKGETDQHTDARLNKMMSFLRGHTADAFGYDDAFMSVIGPLAKRKGEDGAMVSVVSRYSDDETNM